MGHKAHKGDEWVTRRSTNLAAITNLLVHMPYTSSTNAKDKFKTRKASRFLVPLSAHIALRREIELYTLFIVLNNKQIAAYSP